MNLETTIINKNKGIQTKLKLPNNLNIIEDALLKISCEEEVNATIFLSDEYGRRVLKQEFNNCNVFELNYYAVLVSNLDYEGQSKLIGITNIDSDLRRNLEKSINAIMNINQNNSIFYQPAQDEHDLAIFYLENDLIPEIADLKDEQHEWVLEHTDYQSLGEEIVQRERGEFVNGGYVTKSEELQNLYDGSLRMPSKVEYVFKIEISEAFIEEPETIVLELPTTNEILYEKLLGRNITNLDSLQVRKYETSIPILEDLNVSMCEFEKLNKLAYNIKYFEESGELTTFKALVSISGRLTLEKLEDIAFYVDEFKLDQNIRSTADYGREKFKNVIPIELLECLDTGNYGEKLANKNGVEFSEYGALIPYDKVTLEQKLNQNREEKQSFDMSY